MVDNELPLMWKINCVDFIFPLYCFSPVKKQTIEKRKLTHFHFILVSFAGEEFLYQNQWGGISLMNAVNLSVRVLMSNVTFVSIQKLPIIPYKMVPHYCTYTQKCLPFTSINEFRSLFSLSLEQKTLSPSKFALSNDKKFLLLTQNVQKLYRHTFLAQYTLFDIHSRWVARLGLSLGLKKHSHSKQMKTSLLSCRTNEMWPNYLLTLDLLSRAVCMDFSLLRLQLRGLRPTCERERSFACTRHVQPSKSKQLILILWA